MDAKPQRPLRTTRAQGDENVAPVAHNQAIHQRHKSTGALSKPAGVSANMLNFGGLKAAAKRTAFGDVSNTVKTLNTTRDDSIIPSQPADYVKPLNIVDKSAGFLRPAQRPLTAATVKVQTLQNTILTSNESASIVMSTKAPLVRVQPAAAGVKRTTVAKKGTVIYKDNVEDPSISGGAALQEFISTAPVHQNLQTVKLDPQPKVNQLIQRRTESKITVEAPEPTILDSPHDELLDPNQAYEDYNKAVELAQEPVAQVSEVSEATQEAFERLHRQLPTLPAMPAPPMAAEPEEYWEEEDDEDEIYDEQGYTTAHSYRSRGDNTTGGVTTVLFPKVTNKSKKELADAQVLVESSRTTEDIDDELFDVSMVAEYNEDIFAYMRELELKMLPNPHYMENQAEIQWSMRSVLMDWIIQVHHRFSLLPETLFLCVNYIDRFLSCKVVSLGKLQLVGATALFVAAKYEEINCPSVSEVVFMVDGGYTVDEILKAERFMLSMLQFELGWPGPMSFLRRISKADEYDLDTRTLAKYFLEVAIMDERFVSSPASYIAAGSHCLARMLLKKEHGDWSPAHVYYSGYTWTQIRPLVALMLECCENPQKHHAAVLDKFSDRRYKRGSVFVQTELSRGFTLPPLGHTRPSIQSMEDVPGYLAYEAREASKRMVQIKG